MTPIHQIQTNELTELKVIVYVHELYILIINSRPSSLTWIASWVFHV